MPRKLQDWIKGLLTYVEDTEAPRDFWIWSALFTIASALQRKVWLPYGLENIHPNIYVLVVATPGQRKDHPPKVAKRMLEEIEISVAVDSSSKRALTKELAAVGPIEAFVYKGITRSQSALAIISREMSALLAVDPKGVIEVLTPLFDSPDEWKYKTSGEGYDYLYNVCINCFICTTPTWISDNLPQEAIGGGYTSRHVVVTADGFYKSVPIPPPPPTRVYKKLIADLKEIAQLKGPFAWGAGTEEFFSKWYEEEIPDLRRKITDEKFHGFLNRIHIIALKTAMCLHISYSDELILELEDVGRAIDLVQKTVTSGGKAFAGHGRSRLGPDIQRIVAQLRTLKETDFGELLAMNLRHLNRSELMDILESLELSGVVKIFSDESGKTWVNYKGRREV